MSAVTAYAGTDSGVVDTSRQGRRLAPVIDITEARDRRERGANAGSRSASLSQSERRELEAAIRRHPASRVSRASTSPKNKNESQVRFETAPIQYVTRVPAYAKVLGWTAAVALAVGGGISLGLALGPGAYQGETWTHTVASGESLWGVAASLDSSRGLEDVVEDIRALNGLSDATLIPGQELLVPLD